MNAIIRTNHFRPKTIFACVAMLPLYAGFASQCGYASEAPTRAGEAAVPANEDRVIAALPVVPPHLNGNYALKTEPAKRVAILYTCKVHLPRLAATDWVLFAAIPPDLPSQKVSRVTMTPAGTVTADLSPLRRSLLRAESGVRTEAQKHDMAVEVHMDAQLFARRLITVGGKGDSPIFADTKIGTVPRPGGSRI